MNGDRCFPALLIALLVFAGCTSTPNEDAPLADEAHPTGWLADHSQEAINDVDSCKSCHGADYSGGSVGVSCFTCHLSGPPFTVHPASWGVDTVIGHQNFADELSWTSCATSGCHGLDLKGGAFDGAETGPSCFTVSGCHATTNGDPPAPATHTANYDDPADHGPAAKQNQLYCRNCHGLPPNIFDGGFVTPNYGGVGNCSLCHPDAKAHPTDWQGNNDTNANGYTAMHWMVTPMAIEISCSLCHNVSSATRASPMIGAPTCFDAAFENANGGLTGCHVGGSPGHLADFAPSSGGCEACHGSQLNVVNDIHGGQCNLCHAPPPCDADNEIIGINGDGDATLANGMAQAGTWGTVTCLQCHPTATYPSAGIHHDRTESISGNCSFCHADPRPGVVGWQGGFSLNCPPIIPKKLACVICHVESTGTGLVIYKNRFTDNGGVIDQIKSGADLNAKYVDGTRLWEFLDSDVLIEPFGTVPYVNKSVIAHQITHTALINVDNFGICLGCHNPSGGPTGTATPVNVWHGRQEYSEIPDDSSTDAYNMHFDVLRKAPGRDFFGLWRGSDPGDDLPATPPFFSHGKEFYRTGGTGGVDVVAEDRGDVTFRTFGKRNGLDGNEALWRDPTKAVTFTPVTIPCFSLNDAESRCAGATTDVPVVP